MQLAALETVINKNTLVSLVSVFALTLGVAWGPISQAAPTDKPRATWLPSKVSEPVLAGESMIVTESLTLSNYDGEIELWVVPKLRPYVEILSPTSLSVVAGEVNHIEFRLSADALEFPKTVDGTIHVRNGERTIARPLAVELKIVWERVDAIDGEVEVSIPGGMVAQHGGDFIVVGVSEDLATGLPPRFAMTAFDVPSDLAIQPSELALEEIVFLSGLEQGDILSLEHRIGGLLVQARSFTGFHFFVYDPVSNKSVEFLSGADGFFDSDEFSVVLDSLEF